jgi:glycosyltransferase involved in cell wall biosynthesis
MLSREIKKIKYLFFAVSDFKANKHGKTSIIFNKSNQENLLNIGINARFIQTKISGIGKYVLQLMRHIPTFGNNHYYFYEYGHVPIERPIKGDNIHYVIPKVYTKNRTLRIFWEQMLFSRQVKKDKIKIFHGPSFMLPVFKPCKSVITVHDLTFVHYPQGFNFSTRLYYKLFFRRSLENADMIIADSEATKKDLMQIYNIPVNKIQTIYLGVDEIFKNVTDKKKIKEVKRKYSLPEKYFLFVGLLSPRKNVRRALKAFAQLHTEHKFVIVGNKGWLYEPIFKLIEDLNLKERVIFTKYADSEDLPAIYSCAEALIFPSLYEGFGLPIVEAMACGCPVITSNISSMPEVAGDAAILINPYNVEEIKNAMNTIMINKKVRMDLIKKGYENIKRFSWQKMAEKTVKVYERLANQ